MTEPGRDPEPEPDAALDAAAALTESFQAWTGQLETLNARQDRADKRDRRLRRVIAGLAVSLCLDLLITAGLGYNTVRQNSVQNDIRASDIRQCQIANVTRAQDIAIWNRLLTLPPGSKSTAAQRSEIADLERLVKIKDAPRNCVAAFSGG